MGDRYEISYHIIYLGLRVTITTTVLLLLLLNHINNHLIVDMAIRRQHNMHHVLNIMIVFIPLFNSLIPNLQHLQHIQSYGTGTNKHTDTDLRHDTLRFLGSILLHFAPLGQALPEVLEPE